MQYVYEVLSILSSYWSAYVKNKVHILLIAVVGSIFSVLAFVSVGATSAAFAAGATGIRYLIFVFKDKYKTELPLCFCLILHLVALLVSIETITDIIPSALVIIGCILFWYFDKDQLKLSLFILNSIWIFYYMFCGLYITAINVIVINILTIISYYRIKNEKKDENKDKKIEKNKGKNKDRVKSEKNKKNN